MSEYLSLPVDFVANDASLADFVTWLNNLDPEAEVDFDVEAAKKEMADFIK